MSSTTKTQTFKKVLDSLQTSTYRHKNLHLLPSPLDSVLPSLFYSTKNLINSTLPLDNHNFYNTTTLPLLSTAILSGNLNTFTSQYADKSLSVSPVTKDLTSFNSLRTYISFFHVLRKLSTLDKVIQRRKFSFSTASRVYYDYVLSEDIHRGSFIIGTSAKKSKSQGTDSSPRLFQSKFVPRFSQIKNHNALKRFFRVLRGTQKLNLKPRNKFFKRRRWVLLKLRRKFRSQIRFTKKRILYLIKKLQRRSRKALRKFQWKKRSVIRASKARRKLRRFFNNSPKHLTHSFRTNLKLNQGKLVVKSSKYLEKKFGKVTANILNGVKLTPTFLISNNNLTRPSSKKFQDVTPSRFNAFPSTGKSILDLSTSPSHFLIKRSLDRLSQPNLKILKVLIAHPFIETSLNVTANTPTHSSLHVSFQSWLFKFQNYAEATLFSQHNKAVQLSNLWSVGRSDVVIRKKLARASAPTLFKPRLANWYYVTLVKFLETSLGRKVALTFGPFVDDSLSFQEKAKCVMWANRLRGFQRMLGKKIFLIESTRIILASLKLKDPTLLSNWIRAMLKRMSFWKYRLIFRYLDFLIRHFIKTYFVDINVRGFKLQLKGKISVAGNARTRTLFYRVGDTSHSKIDNKVAYHLSLVNSFTGVMGLKVWIFY